MKKNLEFMFKLNDYNYYKVFTIDRNLFFRRNNQGRYKKYYRIDGNMFFKALKFYLEKVNEDDKN